MTTMAAYAGKDRNYIRFLLNPEKPGGRWMGESLASELEGAFGIPAGALDAPVQIDGPEDKISTDMQTPVTNVTVATAAKAETLDLPQIHVALEKLCEAIGTSLKEVFENAPKERRSSVRVHAPAVPKKNRPRKAGGTSSS